MKFFFDFFFFTLGLVIGSFLNAVIFRLRYSRSLLGHSACPDCGHRLGAIDLVPIVSFVWLRGRCRFCRRPISWQYPLVELTTGLVFLLAFRHNLSQLAWGLSGEFVFFTAFELIAVALLILIFVYDLKYFLIPDVFVILGVVGSLLFRILAEKSLADGLYGVLVVSGFFGFLYLVSSGKWIGFGDVKLGLFLGLLLGVRLSLVMLMLAYVTGAIVGGILVAARKKTMKGTLPFGTFLCFSAVTVMFWGQQFLEWYFSNFYY